MFIQFDNSDFYPSITKHFLMSAINLDKAYCPINENEIKIIKRAQKPMLYHNGCLWKKKERKTTTQYST